eukprot:m.223629 g.223629  ORF g.223629 m.223629 type:complete len:99 (+) comp16285_c0_seq1:13-309(+)
MSMLLRVGRVLRGGGSHGHHHTGPQPPNGFLFGEKPLLPGEKRTKAEWENVFAWGLFGGLIGVYVIQGLFAPDTNWDTWARPIAEERLRQKEQGSKAQ